MPNKQSGHSQWQLAKLKMRYANKQCPYKLVVLSLLNQKLKINNCKNNKITF